MTDINSAGMTFYELFQLERFGDIIPSTLPSDEQEVFLEEERRFEQFMNDNAEWQLEELSL